MTIYQWVFFDREEMEFNHFESTNADEVNRKAWEFFREYIKEVKHEDQFVSATAKTLKEFTSKDYQYVDCSDIGGLEATRFILEI